MLEQGPLDSLLQYPLFSPFPPPSSPPSPPQRYLSSDLQLSLNLNRKLCNYMAPVFYSMDHTPNFFFWTIGSKAEKQNQQKKNTWYILVYDGPALYKENCALGLVEYVFFPIQTSYTVNNILKWISGYSNIPLKKIKVLIMLT